MNTTRRRRRDDDDDESPWRISGKLVNVSIVVVLVGATALAWSFWGGGTGSARAEIHGDVTIDGTPVEAGSIHFTSLDAKVTAISAAAIEKGK